MATLVNLKDVTSVYKGRPGCACGCRGKYWYTKAGKTQDYHTVNEKKVQEVCAVIAANFGKADFSHAGRWIDVEIEDGFTSKGDPKITVYRAYMRD